MSKIQYENIATLAISQHIENMNQMLSTIPKISDTLAAGLASANIAQSVVQSTSSLASTLSATLAAHTLQFPASSVAQQIGQVAQSAIALTRYADSIKNFTEGIGQYSIQELIDVTAHEDVDYSFQDIVVEGDYVDIPNDMASAAKDVCNLPDKAFEPSPNKDHVRLSRFIYKEIVIPVMIALSILVIDSAYTTWLDQNQNDHDEMRHKEEMQVQNEILHEERLQTEESKKQTRLMKEQNRLLKKDSTD